MFPAKAIAPAVGQHSSIHDAISTNSYKQIKEFRLMSAIRSYSNSSIC
jgi:hypothetical protein